MTQDGLYKSTDGGADVDELDGPRSSRRIPTGRIGLAVAPSNGNRVYALIESKQGILWRSDDGGNNWTMRQNNTLVDQRPFYFTHIGRRSEESRRRVRRLGGALKDRAPTAARRSMRSPTACTSTIHAIWIAPNDPTRIITGEDGGYALTLDGGDNWFFSANLPIAQVYRVGLSNENPYWVCGGLQDNNGWCAPNNTQDPFGHSKQGVDLGRSAATANGPFPDPIDPNYIWADSENGAVTVINKVTKDGWFVQPYLQMATESVR